MDLRAPAGRISLSRRSWLRDGRLLEWLCLLAAVLIASDALPTRVRAAAAPVAQSGLEHANAEELDLALSVVRTVGDDLASGSIAKLEPSPVSDQEAQVRDVAAQPTAEAAPQPAAAIIPADVAPRAPVAAAQPVPVQATPVPAPAVSAPPPGPSAPVVVAAPALSGREQGLLDAMNAQRAAASLPPLRAVGPLTGAARARSQDMTAGGYFAHVSPRGESWMTLLNAAGWSFSAGGENLAMVGGDEAQSVAVAIEKLMVSPTHRSNILNPAFRLAGVGAVVSASQVTIFATIFTDR
jgi:uncharacterized protein YkwD